MMKSAFFPAGTWADAGSLVAQTPAPAAAAPAAWRNVGGGGNATDEGSNGLALPPYTASSSKDARDAGFPSSRRYLWDRTPAGAQVLVSAPDLLPRLSISAAALARLAASVADQPSSSSSSTRSVALRLSFATTGAYQLTALLQEADAVAPGGDAAAAQQQQQQQQQQQVACLLLRDAAADCGSDAALLAAAGATDEALSGALASCLDRPGPAQISDLFALALCAVPAGDARPAATLLARAVLPACGLLVTPLFAKRMAATPLADALLRPCGGRAPPGGPTGYLTLDRARNLVPLRGDDEAAHTTPLVGVWVRGAESPLHPLAAAAALRFHYAGTLLDRATQGGGAFLLLLVVDGQPAGRCYEVSATEPRRLPLAACALAAPLDPAGALARHPAGLVPLAWAADPRPLPPLALPPLALQPAEQPPIGLGEREGRGALGPAATPRSSADGWRAPPPWGCGGYTAPPSPLPGRGSPLSGGCGFFDPHASAAPLTSPGGAGAAAASPATAAGGVWLPQAHRQFEALHHDHHHHHHAVHAHQQYHQQQQHHGQDMGAQTGFGFMRLGSPTPPSLAAAWARPFPGVCDSLSGAAHFSAGGRKTVPPRAHAPWSPAAADDLDGDADACGLRGEVSRLRAELLQLQQLLQDATALPAPKLGRAEQAPAAGQQGAPPPLPLRCHPQEPEDRPPPQRGGSPSPPPTHQQQHHHQQQQPPLPPPPSPSQAQQQQQQQQPDQHHSLGDGPSSPTHSAAAGSNKTSGSSRPVAPPGNAAGGAWRAAGRARSPPASPARRTLACNSDNDDARSDGHCSNSSSCGAPASSLAAAVAGVAALFPRASTQPAATGGVKQRGTSTPLQRTPAASPAASPAARGSRASPAVSRSASAAGAPPPPVVRTRHAPLSDDGDDGGGGGGGGSDDGDDDELEAALMRKYGLLKA